jgi:hypothetical protein
MKQLMIPEVMEATLVHPNGKQERVRLGQYECFMISEENGWDVHACRPAVVSNTYVMDVTRGDNVKVVFDNPWYYQTDPELGMPDELRRKPKRTDLKRG